MLESLGSILPAPLDVMITTALAALVGIMLLLGGMGAMPFVMPDLSVLSSPSLLPVALPSILGTIAGILVLPVGAGLLGSAAMFFKGKAKGWAYCKKLAVFGIVLSFMLMTGTTDTGKLLNIALGVGLTGVLLGFLHTPVVKELYGKSVPKEEETVELGEEEEDAEDVEATEAAEA